MIFGTVQLAVSPFASPSVTVTVDFFSWREVCKKAYTGVEQEKNVKEIIVCTG